MSFWPVTFYDADTSNQDRSTSSASFIQLSIESLVIIPPRRVVKCHLTRRNVEPQEQGVPNAAEVQPQGEVTNAEFHEAIQMLSQVVTNQVGKTRGNQQKVANSLRIREFLRMNPPSLTSSRFVEDPENFIEELQKKQKGPALSTATAPVPKNKGEYNSENFRAKPAYSQSTMAQGASKPPACAK
uniref:Zinc knuckle family protein n=1 Tax=Solanum tuberosum TaxID=4113 RepID=M1DW43_SOLTU